MKNKKIYIWVKFQKEGIHCYPDAATNPTLKTGDEYDVSFLAHPHRHIFHFTVKMAVSHSNRDVEFIQFKRWLENLYNGGTLQLDYKSCEMIAEDLYKEISEKYKKPVSTYHFTPEIEITVSEDGENGATIHWEEYYDRY